MTQTGKSGLPLRLKSNVMNMEMAVITAEIIVTRMASTGWLVKCTVKTEK